MNKMIELAWDILTEMGYNFGDIVNTDDFCQACEEAGLDPYTDDNLYDLMDTFEDEYEVQVYAPEVIRGDGPGTYVHIDDVDVEDLDECNSLTEDWEDWDSFDDDPYGMNDEDYENLEIIKRGGSRRAPKNMDTDDDIMFDDEEDVYEDAEFEDDKFDDDDLLNDGDIFECGCEDDNCECTEDDSFMEDEEFDEDAEFVECLTESYNKRKGCCPPVKKNKGRLVNLHESLNRPVRKKKQRENLSVNESIFTNALRKLKNSNKAQIQKELKEALGASKYNDVKNALKEGRTTLYTKKRINGKNIQEYTDKELYTLIKEVSEQLKSLYKKAKSVNESVDSNKVKEDIVKKKRLFTILDEELSYRLVVKKRLNEDEEPSTETKTDDTATETKPEETTSDESTENTEETSSEESTEETDPEKDEEVELARVIITVANQAAADDLKSELVDAGVPEDAIEFETEDDEEDAEETEGDETESEEGSEESTDDTTEETASDDTNESLHVNVFRRLLEADETGEEAASDDTTEETEGDETESEEGSADDKPVKVILVNTDYVSTLAQVLSDVYGIEQDEFEEMIGGAIVDNEDGEDTESDESDESSEEETEDEPSSKGDDAIDNMSDDDLAQLFGESLNK